MATYYFIIAEDDLWWVRIKGKSYGGFLLRGHAVKQAIHSARRCSGDVYVVVQEPAFRWRIEWTNRAAVADDHLTAEIQHITIDRNRRSRARGADAQQTG